METILTQTDIIGAERAAGNSAFNPAPAAKPITAHHQQFLDGAIPATILRLALPVLIVLAIQTLVGVAETYFISRLGTDALAGMTLVFPVLMMMTMVSSGGIGGGVSSAVARALGAQRIGDTHALASHALLIAVGFGLLFMVGAWVAGPALYRLLGGRGASLEIALLYSNLVFGASVLIWIVNLLAAALRGAGNVRVPAMTVVMAAVVTIMLSPLLIFGMGPIPSLGVVGAGVAMIVCYAGAAIGLIAYMRSSHSPVRLVRVPIEWRLLKDVLGVGTLSAIGALQSSLIVVLITGMVGHFGADALAGYGIASRIDYLFTPLLFAIGTASITIVGTNVGAGQAQRARQVAITAVWLSAALVACIGFVATLWPDAWLHIFSNRNEVVNVGVNYLTRLGPVYVFTGIGMALIFASQGAQRMILPLLTGISSMVITITAGWYCIYVAHESIESFFLIVAGSRVLFGTSMMGIFLMDRSWGSQKVRPVPAHVKPVAA